MRNAGSWSSRASLLASTWMLAACATQSVPTPPVAPPAIPSPPVSPAPEHSESYLPKALNYSEKVSDWLRRVRELTTSAQPK